MGDSSTSPDAIGSEPEHPSPASVHTASLPALLRQAGVSIAVSTYQAGKLAFLRGDSGVLNTHFRSFPRPMGLAYDAGRLAIGCAHEIWEYRNVPAVCPALDASLPKEGSEAETRPRASVVLDETEWNASRRGLHDACFLPRRSHTTGDVQIHEMAWAGRELWFVNTAFSCLATRSDEESFIPRWRPPFVTHLQPGDCCHLNGLAVRDGSVRYVTALGTSDVPGGWRADKRGGGVLLDVSTGEIVLHGLSMPHSPRWHDGELWLLESGTGTLGRVDLPGTRYEPIAQFPGFTRGLAFAGPLAFVGLSQVRESAVFSDLPLTERLEDRVCGVWVVDVRDGRTVGFVRFEAGVQEIFAVELLPGMTYPDLINHDPALIGRTYVLPDEVLESVPAQLRR